MGRSNELPNELSSFADPISVHSKDVGCELAKIPQVNQVDGTIRICHEQSRLAVGIGIAFYIVSGEHQRCRIPFP